MSNSGVPPVAGRLIDFLIQRGNASGSIKPAPHSLRELKASIQGVPLELLVPSMSGVLTSGNLAAALQTLTKMPGLDLSSLGGFQPIVQSITSALQGDFSKLSPQQVLGAMGAGAGLGAALMTYGGALEAVSQVPGMVGKADQTGASGAVSGASEAGQVSDGSSSVA